MKISDQFFLDKIFLLIFAMYFIFSCSPSQSQIDRSNISTEIICPDNQRFMIRYAYAKEVEDAIAKDYKRKIREKSNENFTVIRIPNIESFHIHKMSPEKMMVCKIIQNYTKKIYPNYIKKFKRVK
jgi:hypothetical protein